MTPFLVCLATVLCLIPASVVSQSNAGDCQEKCSPLHGSGYRCAMRNLCTPPYYDAEKEECYERCMSLYYQCLTVCEEDYNSITEILTMCQANCSGASPSCKEECFKSELKKIVSNPTKREVSIWRTVPVLDRQRREPRDDSAERVSPRDDSDSSWGTSSSDDVGDIFEMWRKKRDSDSSWGTSSSDDVGDIFEIWRKKRDIKRSQDSASSMDMDDLFADWTNEPSSSEDVDDIFEMWRKKRSSSEDADEIFEMWRKKRDSNWSWGSSNSEDVGDIFEIWRKKRDIKRSPDSASSMDMDDLFAGWTNEPSSSEDVGDIFEMWRKKRDIKRTPDSTSWMDMDGIFDEWTNQRVQGWTWEEGNSNTEVVGNWKDKRQAETEIQQQQQ